MKTYQIKVLAVLCADDDGTHAAYAAGDDILERVRAAEGVFSLAGIKFAFDPQVDLIEVSNTLINRDFTVLDAPDLQNNRYSFEPRIDKDSHVQARDKFAQDHKGHLVVFFRDRAKLVQGEESDGSVYWEIQQGGPAYSSWYNWAVHMKQGAGGLHDLAHEMGHYLQNRHNFLEKNTFAQIVNAIKRYVDEDNHPVEEGLDVLDDDVKLVSDTPPTVKQEVLRDLGIDPLGQDVTFDIPVTFKDGNQHTYRDFTPDRSNIMSYFKGPHISAQQAQRVRYGLEYGLKHHLIAIPLPAHPKLNRLIETVGPVADHIKLLAVTPERLVTVTIQDKNRLVLQPWNIASNGTRISVKGEKDIPDIVTADACTLPLEKVMISAKASNGKHVAMLWKTYDSLRIECEDSYQDNGTPVKDTSICALGRALAVTAVRQEDNKVRLSIWRPLAAGTLDLITTKLLSNTSAGSLVSIMPIGKDSFAITYHSTSNQRRVSFWKYEDDLHRIQAWNLWRSRPWCGVTNMSFDKAVMAYSESVPGFPHIHRSNLPMRLAVFREDYSTIKQAANYDIGQGIVRAMCQVDSNAVIILVGDGLGNLRLELWEIAPDGRALKLHQQRDIDSSTGPASICWVGQNRFAVAYTPKGDHGHLTLALFDVVPTKG